MAPSLGPSTAFTAAVRSSILRPDFIFRGAGLGGGAFLLLLSGASSNTGGSGTEGDCSVVISLLDCSVVTSSLAAGPSLFPSSGVWLSSNLLLASSLSMAKPVNERMLDCEESGTLWGLAPAVLMLASPAEESGTLWGLAPAVLMLASPAEESGTLWGLALVSPVLMFASPGDL